MNSEAEAFLIKWVRGQLESSEEGLERSGWNRNPELLTDLIENEGPRENQLIRAFLLGQSYERHRVMKFLLGELEREQPFVFEIAKERLKAMAQAGESEVE